VRILTWIVRILLILLVLRFVLRLLFPQRRAARSAGRTEQSPERLGGELVRDPQCGTYVPKSRALAIGASGGTIYFCSKECRDAYSVAHPATSPEPRA
jgi:uncharacterized protein